MLRTLAAASLGLAALTAAPAVATEAVTLFCASVGNECRTFDCPPDTQTVYDNGSYAGPWLVLCVPRG